MLSSFASSLCALQTSLCTGDKCLGEYVAFTKARISAEMEYAQRLNDLGHMNLVWASKDAVSLRETDASRTENGGVNGNSFRSLAEAVLAMKCDVLNHAKERMDFANQLKEEVLDPLSDVYVKAKTINLRAVADSMAAVENFKVVKAQVQQAKQRVDRARAVSIEAREKLIIAKFTGQSERIISQLATKVWSTLAPLYQCFKSYSMLLDSAEEFRSDLEMQLQTNLDTITQNEENRVAAVRDALRRQLVCETSLVCNRQYDLNSMPAVLEDVAPDRDVATLLEVTLSHNLKKLSPAIESVDAPQSEDILTIPPENLPPPYRPPHTQLKDDGSLATSLSFAVQLELIAEICLNDVLVKASILHDSNKKEQSRVNEILNFLGQKSPHALLRVMIHVTRFQDMKLQDASFLFYSTLLKNVQKHFLSSNEMLAAQLVCFVSQRIIKFRSENPVITAYSLIEEESSVIAEWESDFFSKYKLSALPPLEEQFAVVTGRKSFGGNELKLVLPTATSKYLPSPNSMEAKIADFKTSTVTSTFSGAINRAQVPFSVVNPSPKSDGGTAKLFSQMRSAQRLSLPEEILEDCFLRYLDFQMDPRDSFQLVCTLAVLNSKVFETEFFLNWANQFISRVPSLSAEVSPFVCS